MNADGCPGVYSSDELGSRLGFVFPYGIFEAAYLSVHVGQLEAVEIHQREMLHAASCKADRDRPADTPAANNEQFGRPYFFLFPPAENAVVSADQLFIIVVHKLFLRTTGEIIQVPISAVAAFKNSTTYGSVTRLEMDKVITLWSNIIEGYNAARINIRLMELMTKYKMPEGFEYRFTGEQQEQEETSAFLARALLIALALIMMIMVTQFNSFAKPFIIMASVVFSTIGVFGGIATFKIDFVIIMTGIGIISLAGVVVNNAIVLIDYIDVLKARAKKKLGMASDDNLSIEEATRCIIQGGQTRLRPVLLTAITTILGLTPMAMGLNINFGTLFSELNPQIYFGGDNALFWGPLAFTVIFGLSFATFLTLVVVPAMYLIGNRIKLRFIERFKK